jgi:cell division protein FtsL
MERLQKERAVEEETNRRLRLEVEALRSPRRIEEIAIRKLHMVHPARDEAIVIERVVPPSPPPKSVVAAR